MQLQTTEPSLLNKWVSYFKTYEKYELDDQWDLFLVFCFQVYFNCKHYYYLLDEQSSCQCQIIYFMSPHGSLHSKKKCVALFVDFLLFSS